MFDLSMSSEHEGVEMSKLQCLEFDIFLQKVSVQNLLGHPLDPDT